MLHVIIPSKGESHSTKSIESLQYLPFPMKLYFTMEGKGWPEAINIALDKVRNNGPDGDILLMDDDVILSPTTFEPMQALFDKADIFGFKLLFPNGRIQHAGGFIRHHAMGHRGHNEVDDGRYNVPMYVPHCTASLLYIKRPVIDELVRMVCMMGVQFEDVEFSCRALKKGFRIMYTPGSAIHMESATKGKDSTFSDRMAANYITVKHTHLDDERFQKVLERYPYAV